MKKYINKLVALLVLVTVATSCESDAPLTVLQSVTFSAPITSSASTIVLTEDTADDNATTIAWPAVVFPVEAPVLYKVQFDLAENLKGKNAWVNAETYEAGNDVLSKSFTQRDLNTIVTKLGLKADAAGKIAIRVVAIMDRNINSNSIEITVTPYEKSVVFGEIYMPGAYQGEWDVNTASALAAIEKGIYQGYVTVLPGYGTVFKVNTARNWAEFYGAGANNKEDLVKKSDADLQLPGEGSFQVKVNLNTLKFSATPYTWGIAGDGTHAPTVADPNYGWNNALPMSYDHQTKTWKITADLIKGNIKFKLNNQWAVNYGPNDGSSTIATYDGGAYYIGEAGKYEVTFTVDEAAGVATDKNTYPLTASFTVTKK
jgi:hypothetical protein